MVVLFAKGHAMPPYTKCLTGPNCYENAAVETFFQSLKAAVLWRQS